MSTVTHVFYFTVLYYYLPILCYSEDSSPNIKLLQFYDDDGKVHYIDLTAVVDEQYIFNITTNISNTSDARFWLYSRDNLYEYEELYIKDVTSSTGPRKSNYRPDKNVIFVTHGWLGYGNQNSAQLIKDAYLRAVDVNVIVVDWNKAAHHIDYVVSAAMTKVIGIQIKDFVLSLTKRNMTVGSKVHLIGHSLGAHVMGMAGSQLLRHNVKVARVTGLDPARPFFEFPKTFPPISTEAAAFVDIIHTNRGVLGYFGAVGHADFYPNGGFLQPYCCLPPRLAICHHSCSFVYYEQSIAAATYEARKCTYYWQFLLGLCGSNEVQVMGQPCSPAARGSYFLSV